MNQILTFAFIGGDLRQVRAISGLVHQGHKARVFGLEGISFPHDIEIYKSKDVSDCISGADVVVLPVPYHNGEETLNAPFSSGKIYLNEIMDAMHSNQILLAGKVDAYIQAQAESRGISLTDYMKREEMSVLNGIPTVEGAIEIAMAETAHTIHGSRCLVLGYGRIGKLLAQTLKGLGAEVYVAARKCSDLAWIKANIG